MTTPAELREAYPVLAELIGEEYDEHMVEIMGNFEKWAMVYHRLEEIGKRPEVVKDEEAPANLIGLDQLFVEMLAVIITDDIYSTTAEHYEGIPDEQLEMLKLSSSAIAGICIGYLMGQNKTTFVGAP